MKTLAETKANIANAYRTDSNLNRVKSWVEPVKRRIPSATAEYVAEKLPIAQWLPHYDYRWLLNDVIAGITIGVMFIPQGLAYAKIATIPVEHGLYSSWLPSLLYVFLGTSKELSTGPTSILGLLTAEVVADLTKEGYTPENVASAVAFMAGVYALVVGGLKLGFLLDFVSAPVLTGWISAVALVILLGQVDSLVGLDAGSGTAQIIRDVLGHLDKIKPMTLCIGFTSLAMLYALEMVGKIWGKKNKYLKIVSTSRAVIVLVVFTLVSYLVNHSRDEENYRWAVTEVDTKGILKPKSHHDSTLLTKVAGRAAAPFIAMAVEHLGVGKAFGLRNNYSIDKSQELLFLGVENMANSLFGAMATGGAMSRTAVNSECGVRSPLNFALTAGWILLTLYFFSPALFWIPKATLSAIIIMAVVHLISPPRLFYRYWRMSFIDFVSSMLGFWVTLFTSTEIGLATSVGFSIVYTLLRLAFPRWIGLSHTETENQHWAVPSHPSNHELDVPPEAFLVRFTEDFLFAHAERTKNAIIEMIRVRVEPPSSSAQDVTSKDRGWNVHGLNRIGRIRKRKGVVPISGDITPLHHVVLDFTMAPFIDTTGILTLIELKMELRRYYGKDLQFRFVGMIESVRERFDRSEWEFALEGQQRTQADDVIYRSIEVALQHQDGDEKSDTVNEKTLEV